jgi:glycerophosphoryl diester phosphodiesterase
MSEDFMAILYIFLRMDSWENLMIKCNTWRLVLACQVLLLPPGLIAQSNPVTFIAHRGGIMPGYPENTLIAYQRAIQLGSRVIEIDLRGTQDGEIVIMHDETIDRTTNGTGKVAEHTLAELVLLDAGQGQSIPTFAHVLGLMQGTGVKLLLDIKEGRTMNKEQTVRLVRKHKAERLVIVGARTIEDLREFRRLDPELETLGFVNRVDDVDAFIAAGVNIIRLWPKWIYAQPELVESIQKKGIAVWATAGAAGREELKTLIRLGVNGVLSDDPELMRSLAQELDTPAPSRHRPDRAPGTP